MMIFDSIHTITLSIGCGHIWDVATAAIALANHTGKPVEFKFNDLDMRATPGLTPEELCTNYDNRHTERYNARRNQQVR